MIINYCPECIGRPYTPHLDTVNCPICEAVWASEFLNEDELYTRSKLPEAYSADDKSFGNTNSFTTKNENSYEADSNNTSFGSSFPDTDTTLFNSSPLSAKINSAAYQQPVVSKSKK